MSSPSANIPNEPALFITTQEAIPLLTTLMFGFSIAMIGVGSDSAWPSIGLIVLPFTTKGLAFVLLSISAVFFISATEACLKSYAWDYFSVPEERRRFEQLSDEFHYKDRCLRRSRLWHKLAVWAYSIGFVCVMLGVVVLFWTVSRITSIVVSISLLIALLTSVFGRFRPDDSERFVEFLQRRLL